MRVGVFVFLAVAVAGLVLLPASSPATPFAGGTPDTMSAAMLTTPTVDVTLRVQQLFGKTPAAFQYTVLRAMRQIVVQPAPGKRVRFGVGYQNFDFASLDDNIWSFRGAYEQTQSPWGWGLLAPAQLWELTDFDDLLQLGVIPHAFTYVNDIVRLDGFIEVDRSNSDILGIDDATSYGAGGSASARLEVTEGVTICPVGMYEHYWTGQDEQDDSSIFTAGADVDVAAGETFKLDVYGYFTLDTKNDDLDGSYWEYGASVTITVAEGWGVTIGYEGMAGAEEFDSNTFYVDAQVDF